ncbi:MAG: hypothetical protein U0136_14780 [Bdellovibrionota bacterium]
MLCPNCGVDVGDTLALCIECEAKRAVQAPQMEEATPSEVARSYSQADLLSQFLNFFSTPLGMLLGGSVLFLALVLGTLLAFPEKGIIESAILSIIFAGIGCAAAGPYMFAFDSSVGRRLVTRFVGAMMFTFGLFLYSAYTGKAFSEVYGTVQGMLRVNYRGAQAREATNGSLYRD